MNQKLPMLILIILLAGCSLNVANINDPTLTPAPGIQIVPTSPAAATSAANSNVPNSPFAGQPLMAPRNPTTVASSGGSLGGNSAVATIQPTLNFGISATYRDERLGFALDYPANWFITGQGTSFQIWSVNPANYNLDPANVPGRARGDFIILDFTVDAQPTNESLAAAVQRYRSSTGQNILSETNVDLNGLPAVELKTSSETIIITVINGRTLWIEGLGAPAMFYTVVGTLRAT
jgi:hypothetical protein